MTQSPTPPSQQPSTGAPDGGYHYEATPLPPAAVSSPLAPLLVEKKRSSALSLLLALALVVAVGGVAFAAGRLTAPAASAGAGGGRGGGTGFGNGGGTGFPGGVQPGASGNPGGGFIGSGALAGGVTLTGTVESITPTSLSLKLASGQTIEIPIDTSTTYHGQTAAASGDVTTGSQVQVEVTGFAGFGGGRGFGGGQGGQGGQGGAPSASAPPQVGAPGAVPSPGASGRTGTGQGTREAIGPARDITIVTP